MIELTMEQGTIEWHKARLGIVTSTSLKSAIGAGGPQNTLMYELISERMSEQIFDDFTSTAMTHGNNTEDIARRVACKTLGFNFEKTGILLSTIIKGLGLSPDGIFRQSDKIIGGIEIKCPNSKKHVEYLIKGDIPKEYDYQFLTPFVLSDDIEWWVFMSYDYRNYNRPEFYIHVDREFVQDRVIKIRKDLNTFLNKVNDRHFELCLTENPGSVTVLQGEIINCKVCSKKLDVGDSLLLGDICSACFEAKEKG